ncbi:glycosyltransferase family 2 protein [Stappia sp. ICDLI1TA098]
MSSADVGSARAGDRVCVAICTCDRHEPLRQALHSLARQSVGTGLRVIVVDNGRVSARRVAAEFSDVFDLVYDRVSEPGLTAVRNRSLRLALESGAEFVACLDDDERADDDWLEAHLEAADRTGADIQIGPIAPVYLAPPPGWIVSGGFFVEDCESPTTANLLLRLSCLPEDEADWFQPDYAATGGEDYELITRLCSQGARYGSAAGARVRDVVPADRLTLRFMLRRGLRDGVYFGTWARKTHASFAQAGLVCVGKLCAKLGYAINHLFWSPLAGWRARRAGVDLASAVGVVIGLCGIKLRFYGHAARGE